jgi:hypothetical protein
VEGAEHAWGMPHTFGCLPGLPTLLSACPALPACPACPHLRIGQRRLPDELPHLGGHQLARLLGGVVHCQLSIRQQRRCWRVFLFSD